MRQRQEAEGAVWRQKQVLITVGLASPAQPSPAPYLDAVPSHLPLIARPLLQWTIGTQSTPGLYQSPGRVGDT